MTVILFKDGRLIVAEAGQPINVDLEGLLALVTNPQEGDVLTYNGSYWTNAQPAAPETPEEPAAEEE